MCGGRTSAKPRWSEVLIFWEIFLRREGHCPEESASSDEAALIGGQPCAGEINSGERMLTGGGCIVRRPNFGEAAVVGGDDLLGDFPPAGRPLPGGNR